MKRALTLLLCTALLGACRSAEKQLLQGQYDSAFEQSLQRTGNSKGKKRDEQALLLERSYDLALERDLNAIDLMKGERRSERWPDIVRRYESIVYRENRIKPLLPLYIASEGRYARFDQPNLNPELAEARKQASDYYYNRAENLLASGNKANAREAWELLQRLERDLGVYKDSRQLGERARELGTDRVSVEWHQGQFYLPLASWDALRYTDLGPLQEPWLLFVSPAEDGFDADFLVSIRVLGSSISPPMQHELHFFETREIEVEGGRVMVDSLGNKVIVPKTETIRADLTEIKQEISAQVSGMLEIIDARSGKRLYREPVQSLFMWKNVSLSARGNTNALSPETRARLGGGVLPFPPPELLMDESARLFGFNAIEQLRQQRQRFW